MKHLLYVLILLPLAACQPAAQQPVAAPSAPAQAVAPVPAKQKVTGFFTSSLEAPAGWRIKEVRGFECRFFEYAGTGDYLDRFKGVLRGIAEDGKNSGANAFVNARVSSESHETPGSKARAAIVHVCGDYVIIE